MALPGDSFRLKFESRNKERLEALERRRQERKKNNEDAADMADIFLASFNSEKSQIVSVLTAANSDVSKMDLVDKFDLCAARLQSLQKYVSDSSAFLASYDVRRAQEILAQLRTDMAAKREELLPKPKFSFSARSKVTDKKDLDGKASTALLSVPMSFGSSLGFSNRSGEELILTASECNGKDISLNNIVDCTIKIFGSPSTMQIRNVLNSAIYVGPVSRAVFVYECIDCLFYVACQQLRVHSTSGSKFFIHVTSKAIIEDCEEVGFGMYNLQYVGLDEDFQASGLDASVNNWGMIDDFNWLKLNEHSPNWYEISESEVVAI